jgi:AraC-like DNA-binding protein
MPTGYFAPSTDVLWKLLNDRGIAADAVFREVGIDPACISDYNARVPFERVAALWQRALELTGDPYYGLRCIEFFNLAHLGALGAAWLNSLDLRTGMQRVERYSRLLSDNRKLWNEPGRQESALVLSPDPAPGMVQRADSVLACLFTMCQWRVGKDFRALRVQFHHAAPEDEGIYRQFFGCEVEFACSDDRLVITNELLDRPLAGGDPRLACINDEYLCECLARLDRDDLRTRAMALILAELPSGSVRMEQVARGLHLSSRTLQRRLGALGTSFSGLMDETRRELTLQLLRDRDKSLTEIAFSTGFSSLSAFSTAVRQWTGDTPSRFREPSWTGPDANGIKGKC